MGLLFVLLIYYYYYFYMKPDFLFKVFLWINIEEYYLESFLFISDQNTLPLIGNSSIKRY